MRVVDTLLEEAGRSGSLATAIKIQIGDVTFCNNDAEGMQTCRNTDVGPQWTTIRGNRIKSVHTFEQPYGNINDKSKIVLNNHDLMLPDFKGKRSLISWGAQTTKGRLYDTQPPYYVKAQVNVESQGVMATELTLLGLTDWLGQDKANCNYIFNGTDTIETLVKAVLGATMPCFSDCKAFTVVSDTDYDGIFDVVIPGPTFYIEKGKDTRATVLARLFDMTYVRLKAGCEQPSGTTDTVHLFIPSKNVTHWFSLEDTEHKYLITSDYSEIFAPNDITVTNPSNEGLTYTGRARDNKSWSAIPSADTLFITGLTGNAQADLVANAVLANLRAYFNGFSAKIPMQFGQDLFDRVKLTSRRTKKAYEGNIATAERVYEPSKGEPQFYMNISTGKWFDPRAAWDVMGVGAGVVSTDEENQYLYVFTPCRAYSSKLGDWTGESLVLYGSVITGSTDQTWIKYKVKI